eukprot:gene9488-12040_t
MRLAFRSGLCAHDVRRGSSSQEGLMVASVGPSYNVLSLFQKPGGSAAAADTTAVDAIIDKIQQMKTDASAARLQGASAATQAWIDSSEAGTGETSETSALVAGSVRNANSARADSV